ncbi:alpha/beta fold hydrolase [Actinomadura keratinilytica]
MTRPTPYDGSPALFPSCDGDLAYLDTGPPQAGAATPALVLLHPGWTDHTLWSEVVPLLAARHRVIAPDARGHGASANASRPFRPCDDLAALLRHLGTGPAALIGCSMGADTAVATALEHPDLVRALVLGGGGSGRNMELRTPWAVENAARQQAALAAGDLPGWAEHLAHGAVGPQRQPGDLSPELLDRIRTAASVPSPSTPRTSPTTTSPSPTWPPAPPPSPSPSSRSTAPWTFPNSPRTPATWPTPRPGGAPSPSRTPGTSRRWSGRGSSWRRWGSSCGRSRPRPAGGADGRAHAAGHLPGKLRRGRARLPHRVLAGLARMVHGWLRTPRARRLPGRVTGAVIAGWTPARTAAPPGPPLAR